MDYELIKNKRAALEARHRAEVERLNKEEDILCRLPQHLPAPTIANIKGHTAWVSFPDLIAFSYRPPAGEYTGADMLNELEKHHNVEWLTLGLFKPKGYAASPHAKGRYPYGYEIESEEDIAPLYVQPEQHSAGKAVAHYQVGPWHLRVAVPCNKARLSAKRIESRGNWRFERGSGRVHFPDSWHSLGNAKALLKAARCSVVTDQGLMGSVYWSLTGDDTLTPAEMLRELEG